MSKVLANKFVMMLYLLIGSILLEIVCFHTLGFGVFPEYWIYDIAIVLFLGMIIFAIPNYMVQYILSTIFIILHAILIYANYTLYCVYVGEIFTFDMFKLIKEAADASNSGFFNFKLVAQLVLVVLAIIISGFLLLRKCKKQKIKLKSHYAMLFVAIFACFELISLGTVFGYRQTFNTTSGLGTEYATSESFLMNTTFMKEASYRKFGTYGFYTNLLLSDYQANKKETINATVDYFNAGKMYDNSPVFGADSGNNVIVIMMESLEWFAFGNGTYDPDLKNLSAELTPNIYSLIYGDDMTEDTAENGGTDDGMVAKNFFAKSKTNISEGFGIMGSYPIGQNLSDIAGNGYDKQLNTFGYTLPSVLNRLGYKTSYVHSHTTEFYNRSATHNNIGFDKVFGKNDIVDKNGNQVYTGDDIKFHHWMCEADFVDEAMDVIVPYDSMEENSPFYTFYLNVSSHGNYDYNVNNGDHVKYRNCVIYGKENCELDEDGNYKLKEDFNDIDVYSNFYKNLIKNYGNNPQFCEYAINYECAVMGMDEAIGKIISQLKEYGIYDKTTMLLYSDHYAYYNGLTYDIKGFSSNEVENIIELDTIPFILSSPGLKRVNADSLNEYDYTEYDLFCSAYDVVPTVLDLLGISFNQNFYAGSSLFKQYESYAVSINGETEYAPIKVYYSNVGGIYSQYVYTGDLVNLRTVKNAVITEDDANVLKTEAISTVTKLYYISILNKNALFTRLTNNQFVLVA